VNQKKQKAALALKKNPAYSIREICEIVGISRNTYYKYTREGASLLPKKRDVPPQEQQLTGQLTTESTADPPAPDFLVLSIDVDIQMSLSLCGTM
jgi:predicted DNA-binding transcriptional regulator AlpA